jgi:prepilin-type N-terminal cleavage/methylation domain-containing protein
MHLTKSKKGFTLIELMIVIAIIGILTAVVLAALSSARAKSRDAKRLSDVKQIQLALENYFDNNSTFPPTIATLASQSSGSGAILPSEPLDPSTGFSYFYAISPQKNQYCVGANLETSANSSATGPNSTCAFTWNSNPADPPPGTNGPLSTNTFIVTGP